MNITNDLIRKIELNHGKHIRISSVEGLRALSVTLVFLVHYSTLISPWIDKAKFGNNLFELIRSYGNYGVELFFIISGYLIYSIVMKDSFDMKSFIVKRIQRIYPTYLTVLAIYIALCIIIPSESKLPQGTINSLLYILKNVLLLPGMLDIKPMITVSWTLSYEMFFYLTLPFIVTITNFRRIGSSYRLYIFIVLLVSYFGYCIVINQSISRISVFALGCLSYEAKELLSKRNLSSILGVSLLILSIIATYASIARIMDYNISYIISILSLFVFYISVTVKHNSLNRFFSLQYIRWFGNISYSYFLFHGLCLKLIFFVLLKYLPAEHNYHVFFYILAPLCFIATIIFSIIFYLCVEYPFSLENPIRDYAEFKSRFHIYARRIVTRIS